MILYHYTSPALWKQISEGTSGCAYKGLIPQSSPAFHIDPQKGIFALTSPMPESWMLNKDYPDAWDDLISLEMGIGRMLLEVETISSDEIKVYDYGFKLFAQMYSTYDAKAIEEAEGRYLANGLPVRAYLDKVAGGEDFSLPEVVILNPIPLERLSISKTQPLLDEVIEGRVRYRNPVHQLADDREILLWQIQNIPELSRWTNRCSELVYQFGCSPQQERR